MVLCCKAAIHAQNVKISGQILHANGFEVLIANDAFHGAGDTSTIISDDKFYINFRLTKPCIRHLLLGDNRIELFLKPGCDLVLKADLTDSNSIIQYAGKGELENRLLDSLNSFAPLPKHFVKSTDLGLKRGILYGDSLFAAKEKLLEQLVKAMHPDQDFVNLEKKSIIYEKAIFRFNLAFQLSSGEGSVGFTQGLFDDISLEDESSIGLVTYASFIDEWFMSRPLPPNFELMSDSMKHITYPQAVIKRFKAFKSDKIREYALFYIICKAMHTEERADYQFLIDYFNQISKDKMYRDIIESRLKFEDGAIAPLFTLSGPDGQLHSLREFRGKFVYIDFWATWCGPCRAEFPKFDKLQEEYKDAPLVFLSISIDNDLKAWRDFVAQKQPHNLQLAAKRSDGEIPANSQVALNYHISAIPEFVLIDPEGRIVKTRCPRPSQDLAIHQLFDAMLKK